MTRAEIDALCAAHPGATPSGPGEHDSWKVGGKMFACFGGEGVSVKTGSAETAAMLIDAGAAVRAPYFHRSWVRLPLAATAPDEARHRIAVSHDLVRRGLPASVRAALPSMEA